MLPLPWSLSLLPRVRPSCLCVFWPIALHSQQSVVSEHLFLWRPYVRWTLNPSIGRGASTEQAHKPCLQNEGNFLKKGLVYRKIGSVICDIQVPTAAHSLKNKVAVTVVTECCNSILLYYSFLLSKNKNVPKIIIHFKSLTCFK